MWKKILLLGPHHSILEIFVITLILVFETNIHINFFQVSAHCALESKVLSRLLIIMAGYLTKSRCVDGNSVWKKKTFMWSEKSLNVVHTILLY